MVLQAEKNKGVRIFYESKRLITGLTDVLIDIWDSDEVKIVTGGVLTELSDGIYFFDFTPVKLGLHVSKINSASQPRIFIEALQVLDKLGASTGGGSEGFSADMVFDIKKIADNQANKGDLNKVLDAINIVAEGQSASDINGKIDNLVHQINRLNVSSRIDEAGKKNQEQFDLLNKKLTELSADSIKKNKQIADKVGTFKKELKVIKDQNIEQMVEIKNTANLSDQVNKSIQKDVSTFSKGVEAKQTSESDQIRKEIKELSKKNDHITKEMAEKFKELAIKSDSGNIGILKGVEQFKKDTIGVMSLYDTQMNHNLSIIEKKLGKYNEETKMKSEELTKQVIQSTSKSEEGIKKMIGEFKEQIENFPGVAKSVELKNSLTAIVADFEDKFNNNQLNSNKQFEKLASDLQVISNRNQESIKEAANEHIKVKSELTKNFSTLQDGVSHVIKQNLVGLQQTESKHNALDAKIDVQDQKINENVKQFQKDMRKKLFQAQLDAQNKELMKSVVTE